MKITLLKVVIAVVIAEAGILTFDQFVKNFIIQLFAATAIGFVSGLGTVTMLRGWK